MTIHELHVLQDAEAILRRLRTRDAIQGQAAEEAAERIVEVLARDQERELQSTPPF